MFYDGRVFLELKQKKNDYCLVIEASPYIHSKW